MDIEILEMADRRTLLSDIPKMAIDKVEFHLGPIMYDDKEYESVTPLFDEIIAHRLGMVPVPTDLDLFVPQSECSCGGEGCPNCTIMYSLNKIGPCTVLSGDLEPLGNPDLRVKDEFIPIVELTDGQAVLIYATAVMGTARKHVKWQVANGVGYKYMPGVEVDPARAGDDDVVECAALCPKKVFEVEDGKLVVRNPMECSLCMTCTDHVGDRGGVKVTADDTNFLFKFETDGSLTAQQTLDKALEVLTSEAEDFTSQLESL